MCWIVSVLKTEKKGEGDLHALLHDLADRDQFFCYGGNMQDIFYASLVTFFPE